MIPVGTVERSKRKRTIDEVSELESTMSPPGPPKDASGLRVDNSGQLGQILLGTDGSEECRANRYMYSRRYVPMCKRSAFACGTIFFLMTCCHSAKADCYSEMGAANVRNAEYLKSHGISNGAQLEKTPSTCAEAKRFIALIQTQVDFWRQRLTCGDSSAIERNNELSSSWVAILKRQEAKESELCSQGVPKNPNPPTKSGRCIVGRFNKAGAYYTGNFKNICGARVTFDFQDCDNVDFHQECVSKTTTLGPQSTSDLLSSYRDEPKPENER